MRINHGRNAAPLAAALALAVLMLLPAWSAPPVRAAGAADAQAGELVRLINGERTYLGRSALRLDRYLAGKARDGAIACPNDSSLVMAGRAKDIALFGGMSHSLRLCTRYTAMDAMKAWGYGGQRGEILAVNGGFGTGKVAYSYGCSPSVASCPGQETSTYHTTARAMAGWMRSSGHYSIIVGGYDRVGCGAWIGRDGAYYYACLFSLGGGPIATPRPPSKATGQPGSGGAGDPSIPAATGSTLTPPPWATPSGACGWIARTGSPSPEAGGPGWGSAGEQAGRPAESAFSELPPATRVALVAGGLAATAAFAWPLLGLMRRRRTRAASPNGDSPLDK